MADRNQPADRDTENTIPQNESRNTPTPTVSEAQRSFTCFPLLPTELRLKIWGHTLLGRRFLRLEINAMELHEDNRRFTLRSEHGVHGYVNQVYAKVPAILSTCHESREVGLKHYRARLGDKYLDKEGYLGFNPDLDVIYICEDVSFHHNTFKERVLNTKAAAAVQYLAIDKSDWGRVVDTKDLLKFPNLKELSLVIDRGHWWDRPNSELSFSIMQDDEDYRCKNAMVSPVEDTTFVDCDNSDHLRMLECQRIMRQIQRELDGLEMRPPGWNIPIITPRKLLVTGSCNCEKSPKDYIPC